LQKYNFGFNNEIAPATAAVETTNAVDIWKVIGAKWSFPLGSSHPDSDHGECANNINVVERPLVEIKTLPFYNNT